MRKTDNTKRISDTINILTAIGMPPAQQNERSALCLLALLNLTPEKKWEESENWLIGITPIMDWIRLNYRRDYAPNTRETVRRQTIHQLVAAGIALHNPDKLDRSVNSPKSVYKIEDNALELIRSFGHPEWTDNLNSFLSVRKTLAEHYAKERKQNRISIKIAKNKKLSLSPGEHSALIKGIIEEFGARFVSGGSLIYAGDTGDKMAFLDKELLSSLGIKIDHHGKMPDVILFCPKRNWLFLVESVTSHGPVDSKRYDELSQLFADSKAELVYVTAFPNRAIMSRHLGDIAWETEVWSADSPSHLIHFNGEKFLGPYKG